MSTTSQSQSQLVVQIPASVSRFMPAHIKILLKKKTTLWTHELDAQQLSSSIELVLVANNMAAWDQLFSFTCHHRAAVYSMQICAEFEL